MTISYNIDFDIAGLIILIICCVIFQRQYITSSKHNRRFNILALVGIFSGVMDIITAYTISNASVVPRIVNILCNSIYLLSTLVSSFLLERHACSYVDFSTRPIRHFEYLILVLNTVFLIINGFTGIIFDFADGQYIHGPLFILDYFFPFLFILLIGICLVVKHKSFTHKQFIFNCVIVIFTIIGSTLQIIFPNYLLTFFFFAVLTLVILFSLETPDVVELAYLKNNLEEEVKKKSKESIERQRQIELMILETTQALAQAIDEKDEYTNGHSMRVAAYSAILAQGLDWPQEKIEELRMAALLHDVGKIGIPDIILKKPNKLSEEEYEIIKTHTIKGGKILHTLTTIPAAEIVALYHHERYDGKGYPGLYKGKEIPEFARIVSIADAYDAMNSRRVYRNELDIDIVLQQLKDNSGTQFDPDYLEIFLGFIECGII